MDRLDEIKKYLLPYRMKWLNRRVESVSMDVSCSIQQGLIPILQEMTYEVISRQESGIDRKDTYLLIFYLRSSIVTQSHDYFIMLTDRMLYLDDRRVERYWYPERLYRKLAEDIELAQKEVVNRFIRVTDHEKEFVRQLVEEDYFSFLEIGLSKELPHIQEWEILSNMKRYGELHCFYGEYMGEIKRLL